MDKVIFFGTGGMFKKFVPDILKYVVVVAISDNNPEQGDEYVKKMYIKPDSIKDLMFDYVVICCSVFDEVQQQLLAYGIDSLKIIFISEYINILEIRRYNLKHYMPTMGG